MKRIVLVFFILFFVLPVQATELVSRKNEIGHRNFSRAKTLLPTVYQGSLQETFYCGCSYQDKEVNHASCGYKIRKDPRRAGRIEWEHVVPAWAIGHQRQCWQNGGRANCAKTDAVFAKAEGDMHNLVPAIGEVNNDRSNFRFSVWSRQPRMYGQCAMLVDFKSRQAQPPEAVRGQIARITFYMVNQYNLNLSAQERRLYCVWAKAYPATDTERLRNQRIAAIQGNVNPFISQPALIDRVCR